MSFLTRFRYILAVAALLLVSGAGSHPVLMAQETAAPMPASAVVKAHTFVSMDPVARNSDFQIAVVVDIASGYHMNSHKPLDSYLIPTTLTSQLPSGITLSDTIYPPGKNEKFPFSPDKPLNVYTGSVTLRLKLNAAASAALGATSVPIILRYQACNNSACLPPVKLPLSVQVQVAAAGAKGHAAHPEIFPSAPAH